MSEITQKFLDAKGVEYLWSRLSLEDYPNNETLVAVLNAIDTTKADKAEVEAKQNKTLVVTRVNGLASHTPAEVLAHFKAGGEVTFYDGGTQHRFLEGNATVSTFYSCFVSANKIQYTIYLLREDKSLTRSYGEYVPPIDESVATKDDLATAVADLVNAAPETLDTLGELAAALQENEEIVTVLNEAVTEKANKVNTAFIGEDDSEDIVVVETASPYAGKIHRFSVEINCAPMYIPEDNLGPEFNDDYQPYTDYGVLIFPSTYTDKGKKTRLVISAHGGGGTVSADSSQAEYQSISRYLVANGYAVMDVNGLPEQYAIDKGNLRIQDSCGSYLAIQSYIKAYNYCMENFNFHPEVFLVGISEGGITTTNIVLHTHIPVLAQAGWSPVLDTYNQIWLDPWPWCSVNGPGGVLAAVYGFDPVESPASSKDRDKWIYDEKKLMGYNPMKCNVTTGADGLEYRHYRCPVKFWHCMDDDTVRYEPTEAFIKSIQNAGGTAYLKLYETGGHETAFVGDPVPNPIGNTIAYDGTEIEIKPVCEETFLFFKRFE